MGSVKSTWSSICFLAWPAQPLARAGEELLDDLDPDLSWGATHVYKKTHKTSAIRSRISSKLMFASCVWFFDRAYYGFHMTSWRIYTEGNKMWQAWNPCWGACIRHTELAKMSFGKKDWDLTAGFFLSFLPNMYVVLRGCIMCDASKRNSTGALGKSWPVHAI